MRKLLSTLMAAFVLTMSTACTEGLKNASEAGGVHPLPEAVPTALPDDDFARGVWNGSTYVSTFAGVVITLPDESWVPATDAELAAIMDIGTDALQDNEKLRLEETFQDMMVQNMSNGASIVLQYENLRLSSDGRPCTEKTYAAAVAKGLLSGGQLVYTTGDTYTMEICGQEYLVLPTEIPEYGMKQNFLLRRQGNYMVQLVVTTLGEDAMIEAMGLFGA